jgi:hypothetical protein
VTKKSVQGRVDEGVALKKWQMSQANPRYKT